MVKNAFHGGSEQGGRLHGDGEDRRIDGGRAIRGSTRSNCSTIPEAAIGSGCSTVAIPEVAIYCIRDIAIPPCSDTAVDYGAICVLQLFD